MSITTTETLVDVADLVDAQTARELTQFGGPVVARHAAALADGTAAAGLPGLGVTSSLFPIFGLTRDHQTSHRLRMSWGKFGAFADILRADAEHGDLIEHLASPIQELAELEPERTVTASVRRFDAQVIVGSIAAEQRRLRPQLSAGYADENGKTNTMATRDRIRTWLSDLQQALDLVQTTPASPDGSISFEATPRIASVLHQHQPALAA